MQEYLNHFLGNLDIVNSREVYLYNLFHLVVQLLHHSQYLVMSRVVFSSILARTLSTASDYLKISMHIKLIAVHIESHSISEAICMHC